MFGFTGVNKRVRGVQQSLGRNATAIQANAAELLVLLDEDDFLAEVSRVERRSVSAGACANDYDFCLDRVHRILIRFVLVLVVVLGSS
jgi:hypothetical protein